LPGIHRCAVPRASDWPPLSAAASSAPLTAPSAYTAHRRVIGVSGVAHGRPRGEGGTVVVGKRRGTISYGSRDGASAMTTPHILEILANRVKTSSSLDELYRALTAFEDEVERHHEDLEVEDALAEYIDLDRLPTFGGEPPKNMVGVRSWDEDHLLVGTGPFWILDFVERGEASKKNTIERRAALTRKAYSDRLKDVYRSLRTHKEGSQLTHHGGINLMEQTIGAYFAVIQAERDADARRAVEGEPIDKLIAAFDAWVASLAPGWRLTEAP
jgi:hypothetical protein